MEESRKLTDLELLAASRYEVKLLKIEIGKLHSEIDELEYNSKCHQQTCKPYQSLLAAHSNLRNKWKTVQEDNERLINENVFLKLKI